VRLQSTTTDNVVNYTVVVSVDNSQGKLLPGMTARVSFLTKSAQNVLNVSNAALRFKPATTATTTTTSGAPAPSPANGGATRNRASRGNSGTLYYLDAKGNLASVRVRTGINDGTATEINGNGITEGMKVIAGSVSTTQTAQTSTAASPFGGNTTSSQQQQRGGPRGGF
jgi:HlyD family secretion protein